MAQAACNEIIASSTFTFLIGPDKVPFTLHEGPVSAISEPLYDLMMTEPNMSDKCVTLEDVDVESFTLFTEFVYTRDYTRTSPEFEGDSESVGQAPEYLRHVKACVFADIYEIADMRDLAIEYLEEDSSDSEDADKQTPLSKSHIPFVLEMLRLAYENDEHELGEELRGKVLDFAMGHVETLSKDERFAEVVRGIPLLFDDFWDRIRADGRVKGWVGGMPEAFKGFMEHLYPSP